MSLRILIVSENMSLKMGGESSLPLYYAKLLRDRGATIFLSCHGRVADELDREVSDMKDRTYIVEDTALQRMLFRVGERMGNRVKVAFSEQTIHLLTQHKIRKIAKTLTANRQVDVIFEPAPISPKGLSFMYNVGAPVVIGPLCGGMSFPPAFQDMDTSAARFFMRFGRRIAGLFHKVVPGKLYAKAILVANERTRDALPRSVKGRVIQLFESGVDLRLWTPNAPGTERSDGIVQFAYSGSFIDLKGIRFLVAAFAQVVATKPDCELHLIGDGDLNAEIREQVRHLGIERQTVFHGWISRPEAAQIVKNADVFVMPSLRECGGTAVLEALAMGKPVIATKWGGPAEYVNSTCGLLVEPSSRRGFVDGLADAMIQLATDDALRRTLGEGGIVRVREDYLDWDSKADRVLSILKDVVEKNRPEDAVVS